MGTKGFIILMLFLYPISSAQAPSSQLDSILSSSAEYCERLNSAVFHFVCNEKVQEEIYDSVISARRDRRVWKKHVLQKSSTLIYDYQLVHTENSVAENRTLIEENGNKRNISNKDRKARFTSSKGAFGPISFLSGGWHNFYKYKQLKDDQFENRPVYVIDAMPKAELKNKPNYGRLWIDKDDYSVVKIEVEGKSLAGFDTVLKLIEGTSLIPRFEVTHEYTVLKNGMRFPSKTIFEERYVHPQWGGYLQSRTNITYYNYKFFTIDTEIQY